jgi:hypothetical protein
MDNGRINPRRPFLKATFACAWVVLLAIVASCNSAIDAPEKATSGPNVSALSIVLQPSAVNLSPGGTAQSIGTIRGVSGEVTSTVSSLPNGVSVRVTSVTTTDSVATKKYIFFADAAAAPGTYPLGVRVTVPGQPDVETQLTLTVTAP